MTDWKPVVRVLHLLGGLRGVNNPGSVVQLIPSQPGTDGVGFNIAAFGTLYDQTAALGLSIIGCDFFTGPEQIQGLWQPEWRPKMAPIGNLDWPVSDVHVIWRNIGHEAAKRDAMSVFEKARHISTQLDICIWRLRDLSNTYHRHLDSACKAGSFKAMPKHAGMLSKFIFYSAHAMFAELASLRDHLAMFAARDVLGIVGHKIDSWPRLIEDRDFKLSAHALAECLRNQGQWIDLFGEYRNLFVHNAPMGAAQGVAMVQHAISTLAAGRDIPVVYMFLPSDPAALRDRLRSETALHSYEHWLEIVKERNSGPDALAYCYDTLSRMVLLAYEVSQHSPVPPIMPTITPADVIGEIEVKRERFPVPHLPPGKAAP